MAFGRLQGARNSGHTGRILAPYLGAGEGWTAGSEGEGCSQGSHRLLQIHCLFTGGGAVCFCPGVPSAPELRGPAC